MNWWKFEKTNMVKETSFDQLLERFYKYGVSGLIRENIQNSLDAKKKGNNEPVEIKIDLGTISAMDIPGYDEIEERVKALKGTTSYNENVINYMQENLGKKDYNYLTFEDVNTTGLSGAEHGESDDSTTPYSAYAYSKGVHVDDNEDDEAEKIKGGSHGVGKIASNSASILNTMFFSNCDSDNFKTVGGTVQLIEHKIDGQAYRSTGFFANIEDTKFYPYINEKLPPIFNKDSQGLKIIIPFLRDDFYNKKEIIRSVIDSFLLAIYKNKLIAEVSNTIIDKNNLKDFLADSSYFEQEYENMKDIFAPLYYKVLDDCSPKEISIPDHDRYHKFKLYFYYDARISNGRTAVFRNVGMKIEDKKIKSFVKKPYSAILIPATSREDEFLKTLENEAHNKLGFAHIRTEGANKSANYFINQIDNVMQKFIEEALDENNPKSEIMKTGDILYTIESKFKKDLKKRAPALLTGQGSKKRTIVKTSDPNKPRESQPGHGKKKHRKKNQLKTVKKDFGNHGKKTYYEVPKSKIKRFVHRRKENLEIDLSNYAHFDNKQSGNILISIIDGMGREHLNEFKVLDQYKSAEDLNTYQKLNLTTHSIKSVNLEQKKIKLLLNISDDADITSKLKYYLEV
jgi:hypothetical protein